MFVGPRLLELGDQLGLPGIAQRIGAHRHAAVRSDHDEVGRQPEQHQRHPRHSDVHGSERKEQQIGGDENGRPNDQVPAATSLGEGDELES
jgi:hypothetical protein